MDNKTMTAREAWETMSAEAQRLICIKMLWTARKRAEARGAACAGLIKTPDDADALAGAVWLRIAESIEAGTEDALQLVAYRAAAAALMAEYRETVQHPAASLDDPDARTTADIGPGPEDAAIARDEIRRAIKAAIRSGIDARIVSGTAEGLTHAEIAAIVGITRRAVSKRAENIRARARLELADIREL